MTPRPAGRRPASRRRPRVRGSSSRRLASHARRSCPSASFPELSVEVEPPEEPLAAPINGDQAEAPAAADSDELDGARLIALNMALIGDSRADTDRYLAENFELADRQKLIDEVYAAIEG